MDPPPEMPLLRFAWDLCDVEEGGLRGAVIVAVQHLLDTTRSLFVFLFEQGVRPEDVFLLGKCYSSNRNVFEQFQKDGVFVSPLSFAYSSHTLYDQTMRDNASDFLRESLASLGTRERVDRIIFLDDGGDLLLAVHEVVFFVGSLRQEMQKSDCQIFKRAKSIAGIEQTSRFNLAPSDTQIINVARSPAKLQLESAYVANLALECMHNHLASRDKDTLQILVVGNGSIGSAVRKKWKQDGYWRMHEFDVIIGTSGFKNSLDKECFLSLTRPVIVANFASSDREFADLVIHLRKSQPLSSNCVQDIQENGITLLKSGFPITFDYRKPTAVPASKIQLTRALLLAAVCQAVSTPGANGFVDLDTTVEENIVSHFATLQ